MTKSATLKSPSYRPKIIISGLRHRTSNVYRTGGKEALIQYRQRFQESIISYVYGKDALDNYKLSVRETSPTAKEYSRQVMRIAFLRTLEIL